jgi:hypothetical protein
MFPRVSIAIAVVLAIGVVVAFKLSFPVRFAEEMRAQMTVGANYMKSLKDRHIPPWIERTERLLAERDPAVHPIGVYDSLSGGKPIPSDLQSLKIIRIDILENRVLYVWMGGMDHTYLEARRLPDGTFTFVAHYSDYESEVIWPKRSNHAMERTPKAFASELTGSFGSSPSMKFHPQAAAPRFAASRRSSCSR